MRCRRAGCGEGPDYHLHTNTAAQCDEIGRKAGSGKCWAPQDHHPFEGAPAPTADMIRRNPILGLAAYADLQALDDDSRRALARALMDLRAQARVLAEKSWRQSKGPMAAYWKATATYAGHLARALR